MVNQHRQLRLENLEGRWLLAAWLAAGQAESEGCDVGGDDPGGGCSVGGGSNDSVHPEVVQVNIPAGDATQIDIVFSVPINADSLITDGTIANAVSLAEATAGAVPLSASQFSYVDKTLSLSLNPPLPEGDYRLELDNDLLHDLAGNALRGNSQSVLPLFHDAVLVQAAGEDVDVEAYSTPSLADWNDDGTLDLLVGEKTAAGEGKVRVHLNGGTNASPQYSDFFYVQAGGVDVAVAGSGCLGVFPRLADWNGDGRPDLILGLADGTVQVALNQQTAAAPLFAAPSSVTVGQPGSKSVLDVGSRATVAFLDWNNDQRVDLLVGGLDGKVRLLLNQAGLGAPDFREVHIIQAGGNDLQVPADRASIAVVDLNEDGRKDLVVGNTEGQLLLYPNIGSDAAPAFDGYHFLESAQGTIDLAGTPRSRPDVVDANGDGTLDLMVGAEDGLIRLYLGTGASSLGGDYGYDFHVDGAPRPAWQCEIHPLDVNHDGYITPQDALIIINYINAHGAGTVPGGLPSGYYYDCTGDDLITARDVLLVINDLNANGNHAVQQASGEPADGDRSEAGRDGEGEIAPAVEDLQPPLDYPVLDTPSVLRAIWLHSASENRPRDL